MGFFSSLFGSSKSAPATTTNVISQKLPSEIAPYATEVLTEAQDLYTAQKEKGYDPYTGETIAPLTPEQQQAMTGIAGLVGTSQPLQQEALDTFRQGGEQFTGDIAQQYMSPYQQAVTDIELREAQNKFDTQTMPQFEAAAVGAGGMSGLGSRAGVQAAELQRGQSQLLADIQAKGTQGAYKDAQKAFEDQKAREQQMGTDVARTGPAMFASGLQEQGALQAIGEQKQQLGQSALDEAYFKFLEEQQYPQQQLANYSGFVYGNPAAGMVNQSESGTKTPYQPSFGQSLLGIGSTLGAAYLGSSGGSAAVSKLFSKEGGKVSDGLSGLVRREEGGTVGDGDSQFRKDFINPIGDFFGGLSDKLEQEQETARERTKLGMTTAAQRRSNLSDYFFQPSDDPKVVSGIDALREKQLDQEAFEGRIRSQNAKPNYDEELLQGRKLVDPEIEAQLKEADQADKDAGKKALTTKEVIQSLAGPSTPKALTNKQSAALDEKEAGKKYDSNPSAFGDLTRKQYLADTKAQNEKYLAFVNKMYPEGQNEFLADALAALGSMFIAENKGEAFQKTFSELQAAGVKRRDARRIAIGKVGLENLKRDDATLEKIRMLPKKRREAIEKILAKKYGIEVRDLAKRKTEAQIKKDLALAGKANRYSLKGEKPKASKLFPTAVKEDLVEFMTADSGGLLDIATSQLSKPGVAEKFAQEQGIKANDIGSLTAYMKKAFEDNAIQQDALSEAGKIFAKGDISEQDSVIRGMFTVLKKYKYKPETGFLMFGDSEKFERIR